MKVYVLHRHWDTPSNEGNDIMGAYKRATSAYYDMMLDVEKVKTYFESDFWEEDMTWENTHEVHLGSTRGTGNERYATIYGWEIIELEVQ